MSAKIVCDVGGGVAVIKMSLILWCLLIKKNKYKKILQVIAHIFLAGYFGPHIKTHWQ
jgi:hypothetical protein